MEMEKNKIFVLSNLKEKNNVFSLKDIYDSMEYMLSNPNLSILEKSYYSYIFFKYIKFEKEFYVTYENIYTLFNDTNKIELLENNSHLKINTENDFTNKLFLYKVYGLKNMINENRFCLKKNYKNTKNNFLNDLKKVIYSDDSKRFYFLNKNNNIKCGNQKDSNMNITKIKLKLDKNAIIEDINIFQLNNYLKEKNKLIFCVSTKKKIYFFDYYNMKNKIVEKRIKFCLMKIHYSKTKNEFITLDYGNNLIIWKIEKFQKKIEIKKKFSIKTTLLSFTFLEIPYYNYLSIASYGGIIQIFDTKKNIFTKKLFESKYFSSKNTCIKNIKYCDSKDGYILSYGNENYISVWNANLDLKKQFKGRLIGHMKKIVAMKCLKTKNEVISIDKGFLVRIWNLCLMNSIQVFKIKEHLFSDFKFKTFLVVKSKKEILIFGKKVHVILNSEKIDFLSDNKLIKIETDVNNREVYVIYQKQIKIFSLLNGKLKTIFTTFFENLNNKIIQIERDEEKKIFFILDENHNFKIIKEINCVILKEIHNPDLTKFYILKGINLILFINKKNKVDLYYYSNNEISYSKSLIYKEYNFTLTTIFFYKKFNLLFTGDELGITNIWDLEKGIHKGIIKGNKKKIIKIDIFFETQILFIVDGDFCVNFWFLKRKSNKTIRGKSMANGILKFIAKINIFDCVNNIKDVFMIKLKGKTFKKCFQKLDCNFENYFIIWILNKDLDLVSLDITKYLDFFNKKIHKIVKRKNGIFKKRIYEKENIISRKHHKNSLNRELISDQKNYDLKKSFQLRLNLQNKIGKIKNKTILNTVIDTNDIFLEKIVTKFKINEIMFIKNVENKPILSCLNKNGIIHFISMNKNLELGSINTKIYLKKQNIDLKINYWKKFVKMLRKFLDNGILLEYPNKKKIIPEKNIMIENFIKKHFIKEEIKIEKKKQKINSIKNYYNL